MPPVALTRTVRFCVSPHDPPDADASARTNTFAAWPRMTGIGAYYELDVTCRGEPDPVTGYLINITEIDRAVRGVAIPRIRDAMRATTPVDPAALLSELHAAVSNELQRRVVATEWRLTPTYALMIRSEQMNRVLMRQQFEFSAAHRLHCRELSDEANVATFGKCNNPNGHGHNYRIETTVASPIPNEDEAGIDLATLERIVDETVVDRFDHTHLNLDTDEFAETNPSVEAIARVCHDLLVEPIGAAGGELRRVSVWETGKTRCDYPA